MTEENSIVNSQRILQALVVSFVDLTIRVVSSEC